MCSNPKRCAAANFLGCTDSPIDLSVSLAHLHEKKALYVERTWHPGVALTNLSVRTFPCGPKRLFVSSFSKVERLSKANYHTASLSHFTATDGKWWPVDSADLGWRKKMEREGVWGSYSHSTLLMDILASSAARFLSRSCCSWRWAVWASVAVTWGSMGPNFPWSLASRWF